MDVLLPPMPPLGPGFAEWYQEYKRSKSPKSHSVPLNASYKRRHTFRTSYAFAGIDAQSPTTSSNNFLAWKSQTLRSSPRSSSTLGRSSNRLASATRMNSTLSTSVPSLRGGAGIRMPGNASPPPRESRWWLSEVSGDKKVCQGVFEVFTGLVPMYNRPSLDADLLGNLRAGTMFKADTHPVGKSLWLKLVTEGVAPPLFSLERDGEDGAESQPLSSGAASSTSAGHPVVVEPVEPRPISERLYKQATRGAMHVTPELETADQIWIEFNQQYISRRRDTSRQKAHLEYGTCSCPTNLEGLRRSRRKARQSAAAAPGSQAPPLNRTSSAFP